MTERTAPRILLAAPSSGSGKTTVSCAILQAFQNRGLNGVSFKCGPDYIDPMFHQQVLGIPSRNLDLFFAKEETVRFLLHKNSVGKDYAFIEGVMGYYDGIASSSRASSWHLAQATDTPVILVLNCRGMSVSIAAQLGGYLTYEQDSHIRGVILNQISKSIYPEIKALIEQRWGIPVCGYMPKMSDCSVESRHLGLVTAVEIADIERRLHLLGEQAEESIDLDLLLEIAAQAPDLSHEKVALPEPLPEPVRIGVAKDKAFCFYYEDNLDLLRELGAELIPFSPLSDSLPEHLDGLLIGGGYPELYAPQLSQNTSLRNSLKSALEAGIPCLAECGGFQYLQQELEGEDGQLYPMVGYLPGKSWNAHRLCRFGYVDLTAQKDNMLCPAGEGFPAHEFHYWDSEFTGDTFTAQKPMRKSKWECMVSRDHFLGGYPHLYYYSNPMMAKRFLEHCMQYHQAKLK